MNSNSVAVIDIHELGSADTLALLDRACREWGFFQVIHHGIPQVSIREVFTAAHSLFALPAIAKRRIERTRDNPWGFYDQELTKNRVDWKQIYDFGPADGGAIRPQWPDQVPGFRSAVQAYYRHCEQLAFRLLAAISTNMGMRPGYLSQGFGPDHTSFLRMNYYPICPSTPDPVHNSARQGGQLGVGPHTDAGALTLLLQDSQPGLQVFKNGGWHTVEPRQDAIVVNIGDMVQVWSNDRYQAALHRAITHTDKARFSIPFFLNPSYRANYRPLPTMVSGARPARYREINWGEFRERRTSGDYADYGEEIQIAQYRISA
jgi:isopenicillin N synthase-like dioxygenase